MSGISKGENPTPRMINFLISGLYNGEKYRRSFSVFKRNALGSYGNIWGLGSGSIGVQFRHSSEDFMSLSLQSYMSNRRRQHRSDPSTNVSSKFEPAKVPSFKFSIPRMVFQLPQRKKTHIINHNHNNLAISIIKSLCF
jgi:hypothetical protein